MSDSVTISHGVVALIRELRGWLRFFAVVTLVLVLWVAQFEGPALIAGVFGGGLRHDDGLTLVTGITLGVLSALLWRQANATSRFLAAPTEDLFITVTSDMRRFWRIGGPLAVCTMVALLTAYLFQVAKS